MNQPGTGTIEPRASEPSGEAEASRPSQSSSGSPPDDTPVKRRALGRGLGALLPGGATPRPAPVPAATPADLHPRARVYFQAGIEDIQPAPDQPRKRFGEAELEELAQSIRAHGVIQPLIVRAKSDGGFILIAGERRWRAAQRAGLQQVPVVVQDVSPKEAFERALVENLQRSDLNPMEEAEAYARLVSEHGYTQEQVAERVGKERSTVANSLRLLKLPASVRQKVEEGALSMGHARALLALESVPDIEAVSRQVQARGLSVRATESLIRQRLKGERARTAPVTAPPKSASVRDVENRLTKSLGAQVSLSEDSNGKGGTIEIRYADLDDLDRLLERLLRR
jgi:ParB family transcriptional regulator, chromosome partitioning protein